MRLAAITGLPHRGDVVDVNAEFKHCRSYFLAAGFFLRMMRLGLVRGASAVLGHSSVSLGNCGLSSQRVSSAISSAERPRCDLRVMVNSFPLTAASVIVLPSFWKSDVMKAMPLVLLTNCSGRSETMAANWISRFHFSRRWPVISQL